MNCRIEKGFRRLALSVLYALSALLFCACTKQYNSIEEATQANARAPRGVTINGLNVGGMTAAEMKALLETEQAHLATKTEYKIVIQEKNVSLSGAELLIKWNTQEVILQALNTRIADEKQLFCSMALDREACRGVLSGITETLYQAPQNAKIMYADGEFSYRREESGRKADVGTLTNKIADLQLGISHKLEAPIQHEAANYTQADAERDTALLASFSTSFGEGNYGVKNRVHNIKKAASLIDGYVLQIGETFDMNAVLGPRNRENGWQEATAIRKGTYVQEYGGGVCQVSTTLYNAVLMADLEIVERTPHSWPLGYVDIGRDATISTGGPNFRFTNTTAAPLYICAYTDVEEKTIRVALHGRKRQDGISIKLRSEKIETIADPGDEIRIDRSLPAGKKERVRESRAGSISETYKQYYSSDGSLIREELVCRDKYRAIKGIIAVSGKKTNQSTEKPTQIYG